MITPKEAFFDAQFRRHTNAMNSITQLIINSLQAAYFAARRALSTDIHTFFVDNFQSVVTDFSPRLTPMTDGPFESVTIRQDTAGSVIQVIR